MTTIPGHNQILPQSSIAQGLSNQGNSPKPSPDQAAVLQQAQEIAKGSIVQDAEESERLKQETAKRKKRALARRHKAARKKKKQDKEMALDPDVTGRLLDTTV